MTLNRLESTSAGRVDLELWAARAKESRALLVWLCLFAAISASLLITKHLLPFAIDDALISYRYSDRLLRGRGLTWNDGEFVEGYSNLLWVLIVLLATTAGARAVLDSSGKLVARLQAGDARIEDVDLPRGIWEVSLDTDGLSQIQLATLPITGSTTLGLHSLRIVSEGGQRSFRVSGGHGLIYAIIVTRMQDGLTGPS